MDHRVWSETGCTCFLLTSTEDVFFNSGQFASSSLIEDYSNIENCY